MSERGFFDEDFRLEKLSELGDPLEKLDGVINWELFREALTAAMQKEAKGAGGRPPFDYVMMFKILVLQRIYNISDDQAEFQINDRMSFQRFLGLKLGDRIPDAKTIWHFRNCLAEKKTATKLFHLFNKKMKRAGIIMNEGVIVDATFVDAPRQRNGRDENKTIKEGGIPGEWKDETNPKIVHKARQKDTDARWAKKRDETHYGYKNHVKADAGSKMILDYTVTDASVHDSAEFSKLVNEEDKLVYADAGYVGKGDEFSESVKGKVEFIICEKGYRNRPLTDLQKLANTIKSRIRCRIEHIFGFMTASMHGLFLRSVGKVRAEFNIGLTNLVYNMCRWETLTRCKR